MPVYLGSVWILTCGRSGLQEGVAPGPGQGRQAPGEGQEPISDGCSRAAGRAVTVTPFEVSDLSLSREKGALTVLSTRGEVVGEETRSAQQAGKFFRP